jgi:prevent-host-death family protein
MTSVGMHEAKTRLSQLVSQVERGEDVVITRNGEPVAKLTPIPKRNRMAEFRGISKHNPAVFAEDFDELPAELAEAFGMTDAG